MRVFVTEGHGRHKLVSCSLPVFNGQRLVRKERVRGGAHK